MGSPHKALQLYTENGLKERHLQDSELIPFMMKHIHYLKKADSNYINPPILTPTKLIQTQLADIFLKMNKVSFHGRQL